MMTRKDWIVSIVAVAGIAASSGLIGYAIGARSVPDEIVAYREIQARQASWDEGFELGKSMIFYCGRDKAAGFLCWQRTSVKMEPTTEADAPAVLHNGKLEMKRPIGQTNDCMLHGTVLSKERCE